MTSCCWNVGLKSTGQFLGNNPTKKNFLERGVGYDIGLKLINDIGSSVCQLVSHGALISLCWARIFLSISKNIVIFQGNTVSLLECIYFK